MATRKTIESRARDIEEASGRKLTQRQKEFARLFVDTRMLNAPGKLGMPQPALAFKRLFF